jgi:hypothetical protein
MWVAAARLTHNLHLLLRVKAQQVQPEQLLLLREAMEIECAGRRAIYL